MTYQVTKPNKPAAGRLSSVIGQMDGRSSALRDSAAEWGRLAKAATGWPWAPEQWISLSAILLAGVIGVWLMLIKVGWGDYGQWLMVSRAYLGKEIPDYRDVSSLPPLAPLALAVVSLFTSSPVVALQLFKGMLGVGLTLSVYMTGKSIYRSRAAGLISAVVALLVADRMLELFAFGGLLQIMAMIFMISTVGLAARAARDEKPDCRWWSAAAAFAGLTAFTHVGTGVVTVFTGGVIVAGALAVNLRWSWRDRAMAVAPFAVLGVILLAYYIPVLLPDNGSYATNPASDEYRGVERIWVAYGMYFPNWVVIAAGAAFLVSAVYRSYQARKVEASYINLLWATGVWGFLLIAVLIGSATDYPRFTTPLLAPLAVATGGGLAMALAPARQLLRFRYQRAAIAGIPVLASLLIIIAVGFNTVGQHNDEAAFYALPELDEVRDMAAWLADENPGHESVVAPTRAGKWIEGLTGIPVVMDIPVRFSFRESELERSIANQTMLRSVSSLVNEQLFIKFIDGKEGADGLVPASAWVGINHGGEYVDVLRQPTSTTRIFTGGGTTDLLATLGALEAVAVAVESSDNSRAIVTTWTGARRGAQVDYTRTFALASGSSDFTITDTASSSLGISGLQVEVWPLAGTTVESVLIDGASALLTFPVLGSSRPQARITASDPDVEMTLGDSGLVATTTSDSLSLTYTVVNPGQPLHKLDYLTPEELIERLNIGYVVLESNDASAARAERLAQSGFFPVYFAGPYTVFGLRGVPLTTGPSGDNGGIPSGSDGSSSQPDAAFPTATPALSGAPVEPTPSGEPNATATPGATSTPAPTRTPTPTPTPVPPPAEMIEAALWASENGLTPADVLLAANADDAEWLFKLTNADTIALGAISASDDDDAVRRSVVADALLRSSTALVNENYSIKFIDTKPSATGDVPRQLWAAGNANGIYEALLRILPADCRVLAGPDDVLATQNALDAADVMVVQTDGEVRITTLWQGARRGGTVEFSRTVVLKTGSNDFEVIDEVTGTAPIAGLDVTVRPPVGLAFANAEVDADGASAGLASTGANPLMFNITSEDEGVSFQVRDGAIAVTSAMPNRLHMRFSMPVAGDPISELRALVPAEIVQSMGIRAVFLRRDDAFPSREKRLNSLGFTTVAEFGSLVVMTREVGE